MAASAEALQEFLLREDVPDEAKQQAVDLYREENPEPDSKTTTTTPTSEGPATTTTTTPGTVSPAAVAEAEPPAEEGDVGWTPTIARTAGPIVGAAVGSVVPVIGTAIGGAAGALAGDWIAQSAEVDAGVRTAYNPLRGGAEMITAGYFSKFQVGKTLMQAAAKGALGNIGSDTFINLTEGKGLPTTYELAMSGLTGSIMAGMGHHGEVRAARRAAAKELTGSDEVADTLMDFMGPKEAGRQLELPGSRLEPTGSILDQTPAKQLGFPDVQKVNPETGLTTGQTQRFSGEPDLIREHVLTPAQKGQRTKFLNRQAVTKQKWSDQEITEQFGFDDVEEGRTFHKLLTEADPPDNYSLNLGDAGPETKGWKIAQITQSEQDEWARMKGKARGKKEMLDSPLDRDSALGDVSDVTNEMRGVAKKARKDMTNKEKARIATTRFTKSVGRAKDIFKRQEEDFDYPVYEDYNKGSQAYRTAQRDVGTDSARAAEAIANTSKADRTAIWHCFTTGGDASTLPKHLRSKAAQLWDVADKQLAEYSLTAREYFSEYIPQVTSGKSMKTIIEENSAPSTIPKRLQFAEDASSTILSPQDPSIVRVMNKLIDVGAYRRHVADIATELKMGKYGKDGDAPAEIKVEMHKYLNSLKGSTGDPSAETTDNIFGIIAGKLGWDMTGTEIANGLIRSTYTGLMGLRPSSIIRNAMQTIQTGVPIYGVKSFGAGLKRAFTDEGMDIVRRAGILDEGNMLKDFAEGQIRAKKTGGILAPARWLKENAFTPFQYVEEKNRAISYLAGMDKFDRALEASKKVGNGRATWKTLMDKADIDTLSEPEIEVLSKMWDAGESMDKIRHMYSQGIVDDTQFMYLMPERARVLQSQAGRVSAGFANWSQGYASYVARLAGQGPVKKRVRKTAMWAGTNLAVAGAFAKVGGVFGDEDGFGDALGWTLLGPLFYTGGPILTTAQSISETARKKTQGQIGWATAGKQTAKDLSTFVPFGGVSRDIIKSVQEPTAEEMMGRFLGFKRGKS